MPCNEVDTAHRANALQPLAGTTYLLRVFGCQMNFHDGERVRGMLETAGSLAVETVEEADIVVFLTCCVREAADTRLYGQVSTMRNVPPRAGSDRRIVAVGGCIGQRDGDKLFELLGNVEVVFGTHTLNRLPDLLLRALAGECNLVALSETDEQGASSTDLPSKRDDAFHAWVPVTYGCDNFCTYCIVPYVRGREHSRVFENVMEEVRGLAAATTSMASPASRTNGDMAAAFARQPAAFAGRRETAEKRTPPRLPRRSSRQAAKPSGRNRSAIHGLAKLISSPPRRP